MLSSAFTVILAFAAAGVVLSRAYLRQYSLPRPPIGVINLWDVGAMLAGVILLPYLYLGLPSVLVTGLLGASLLGILAFGLEPLLPRRAAWLAALALVLADVAAARAFGAVSAPFFLINNLVLIAAVVGAANLWAQGGLRPSHTAALAAGLTVYDAVFTWGLPVMGGLFSRLAGRPFAPMVAWPLAEGAWLGLGLGDLLVAALVPLVMERAHGPRAGRTAMVLGLAALAGVPLAADWLGVPIFPVILVLGPLTIAQVAWLRAQPPAHSRLLAHE